MAKPGPSRPVMVCSSRAAAGLIGGRGGGLEVCCAGASGPNTRQASHNTVASRRMTSSFLLVHATNRVDDHVFNGHVLVAASRCRANSANLVHHVHALRDLPEDGVAEAVLC